jgi:hypothetical protein
MNSKNSNTTLIMFAVIAAFGLVMATVAVLPIVQQAQAVQPPSKSPCGKPIVATNNPNCSY